MKKQLNEKYDGSILPQTSIYPNGRVVESTYNNLHQAELVKSDIRGTSALETVADYDYLYDTAGDKRQLLSKMTYDSDTLVSVDYGYDELGRSTKKAWLTSAGTGSTVVGFENTYDEYGNRLTDNHLHRSVDSETYLFDSAQRFTKYERGTIGQAPAFTQGYTLDDIGNWSSFDNNGSTESRLYSSTNELTTQGTHSLAYDSNGNSLNSKTHKYIWDELNRLIEVQDNASNTIVTYYYDVHNLRVLKDFGATDEIRYYYCGNKVIEERDENEVLEREYIMGKQYVDEVLMYIDHTGGSATNYFYMTDLRFSNYAIIDGLGNLIERYKYNGYFAPRGVDPLGLELDDVDVNNAPLILARIGGSRKYGELVKNRDFKAWCDNDGQLHIEGFSIVGTILYTLDGVTEDTDWFGIVGGINDGTYKGYVSWHEAQHRKIEKEVWGNLQAVVSDYEKNCVCCCKQYVTLAYWQYNWFKTNAILEHAFFHQDEYEIGGHVPDTTKANQANAAIIFFEAKQSNNNIKLDEAKRKVGECFIENADTCN